MTTSLGGFMKMKRMNWVLVIQDIQETGMSMSEIARKCERTPPWVHGILSGKTKTVAWEAGQVLLSLQRRALRQK